jgi:uncharacterized cupin superfamily protein
MARAGAIDSARRINISMEVILFDEKGVNLQLVLGRTRSRKEIVLKYSTIMCKILLRKITGEEIEKEGISKWPVWEKEVSRFPWTYDTREECLILKGEFTVETDSGTYLVQEGDFVIFEPGLSCIWDIKKAVKKHYRFSPSYA